MFSCHRPGGVSRPVTQVVLKCQVWSINQCTLGHPCHFFPRVSGSFFDPEWGARGARFPCCPSRKLPLLLGYVYFPSEAGGWLDVFQRHCASQPVGWGAGLDSCFLLYLLPSGVGGQYQGERSGLSAGQSLASLASLSLGEE